MNKLRALIVDDEILVANLLSSSVNWDEFDIEKPRVATAVDDALSLLEEEQFDILFTDINMPIVNGLVFARKVATEYPNIQIIVVSGYDDFEYARESVSIGVLEYIQKPIRPDEIRSAVLRAKENILKSRKNVDEYAKLRDELFSNLEYLRELMLNKLVLGNFDTEQVTEMLARYDIIPIEQASQVAVIELFQVGSSDVSTHMLLCQSGLKLLKGHFERDNERYAFLDAEQRIVLLAFRINFDFYDYGTKAVEFLTKQLPCVVHMGIGHAYECNSRYKNSYVEAVSALRTLNGDSDNAISEMQNIPHRKNLVPNECIKEISQLLFFMQSGLEAKVVESLNLIKGMLLSSQADISTAKTAANGILAGITQSVLLAGIEDFPDQLNILGKLYNSEDIDSLFSHLTAHVCDVTGRIFNQHIQDERQSINGIREYLSERLSDNNLSLSIVSKQFNYNRSYLSRLFKKETGSTFSEYLMQLRMSKAIELIRENEMRSYQIAEKVGFIDANYFSTCFKKFTGMTVVEYRLNKKTQ